MKAEPDRVEGGLPTCAHQWVDWVGGDVVLPVCEHCGAVKVTPQVDSALRAMRPK